MRAFEQQGFAVKPRNRVKLVGSYVRHGGAFFAFDVRCEEGAKCSKEKKKIGLNRELNPGHVHLHHLDGGEHPKHVSCD